MGTTTPNLIEGLISLRTRELRGQEHHQTEIRPGGSERLDVGQARNPCTMLGCGMPVRGRHASRVHVYILDLRTPIDLARRDS